MGRSDTEIIAENLSRLRAEMAEAAIACGRSSDEVKLVAATKYVSLERTRLLYDAGCQDLAESRPQDLWPKATSLSELPIRWHFIGHLQRNKLAKTLPLVTLLHSIDSLRLLEAVLQWADANQHPIRALLEINISGDASKHGFVPSDASAALAYAADRPSVKIEGLMGMASLDGGPVQARRDFAALRELRDQLQAEHPSAMLRELSMGMSGDFREAITEGATLVRIGSAIFEGIDT